MLMGSLEQMLWSYVRGETEERAFEAWVYENAALEEVLGQDYLTIISLDFSDARKGAAWERIEAVRQIAKRHFPHNCCCAELKSLAFINMGSHDAIFASLRRIRDRGPPRWWLAAYACEDCGQAWLVVQEERFTDSFIMRKLTDQQKKILVERDEWPIEFDTWAQVLAHLPPGRAHPQDLLVATMLDLAREQPNIHVTRLASILNLDMATAVKLARRAVASHGAPIALPEDPGAQNSSPAFETPKPSNFFAGRFGLTRRLWAFPVVTASWAYYFGNYKLSIGCGVLLLFLLILDLVAFRSRVQGQGNKSA